MVVGETHHFKKPPYITIFCLSSFRDWMFASHLSNHPPKKLLPGEPWLQPWLFAVDRGWNPTRFYRGYDPYEPIRIVECHKGFERCSGETVNLLNRPWIEHLDLGRCWTKQISNSAKSKLWRRMDGNKICWNWLGHTERRNYHNSIKRKMNKMAPYQLWMGF